MPTYPRIINRAAFVRAWRHGALVGRLPILLLDDSNGAFQPTGQLYRSGNFHGLQHELLRRTHRLYRSGIAPASVVGNGRARMIGMHDTPLPGDGWWGHGSAVGAGADQWRQNGGDAFDENTVPSTINIPNGGNDRYLRWPATNVPTRYWEDNRFLGIAARPVSQFAELNRPLRAWFVLKAIAGGGSIRPVVRRDGTATVYALAPSTISLDNGGGAALFRTSLDFTATVAEGAGDSGGVALHVCDVTTGGSPSPSLLGEIVLYWRYIEDPAVVRGFSLDLLHSMGGQSGRDSAIWLGDGDLGSTGYTGMSSVALARRVAEWAALNTGPSDDLGLVIWKFGMNDRNEGEPSQGGNPDGDSPEAYLDNFAASLGRLRTAWTTAGKSASDLIVLVDVGHALDPADAELGSYFEAIADAASALGPTTICAVESGRVLVGEAMTSRGYYDASGQSHLTYAGYRAKWRSNLDALLGDRRRVEKRAMMTVP